MLFANRHPPVANRDARDSLKFLDPTIQKGEDGRDYFLALAKCNGHGQLGGLRGFMTLCWIRDHRRDGAHSPVPDVPQTSSLRMEKYI